MINTGVLNGNAINAAVDGGTLIDFVAEPFYAQLSATVEPTEYTKFTGTGYKSELVAFGGFQFRASGYKSTPTISLTPDNNSFFTATGYRSTLQASLNGIEVITFVGRTYKSTPEILGGFFLTTPQVGRLFTANVATSERINFTGVSYASSLIASSSPVTDIKFTATGYRSSLSRIDLIANGYASSLVSSFEVDTTYAQAYVMNIMTNEVSRYTDYPFFHIAKIGADYYGINENGIYLVDHNTLVGGSIRTADTDFADDGFSGFQSKNVSFAYLNSDTQTTVTPYVDGVKKTGQKTHFSGRRVVLGRGNRGRYWSFKIDNIQALQGIEYTPDKLSRRVK